MAFDVAWEVVCFKLTAQFPTRNLEFSADFSHTSGTHLWTLAGGTTQNPGGSAILPTAKFATANLTWGQIPPPPPRPPSVVADCTSAYVYVLATLARTVTETPMDSNRMKSLCLEVWHDGRWNRWAGSGGAGLGRTIPDPRRHVSALPPAAPLQLTYSSPTLPSADLRLCLGGRDALEEGEGTPPPPLLQGAQPVPSHCPPDGKCQLPWHL